jgi:hypothetical protein
MTKAKQKIKVIDSQQLRDLVLNIDKEDYAKQKQIEAYKDMLTEVDVGWAGNETINRYMLQSWLEQRINKLRVSWVGATHKETD